MGWQLPRVVFMGLRGTFSYEVLRGLLHAGIHVVGVFVGHATPEATPFIPLSPPPPVGDLPLLTSPVTPSIITLAWEHGIPVWQVHQSTAPAVAEQIAALHPDFLCVACFDQRLPRALLALPAGAALNVHPSLLPRHRGPAPLFWTFRANERLTGVSVHVMTEHLDAGALVAQQAIAIVEGQRASIIERTCARVGGRLVAHVVRTWPHLTPTPQDESLATYEAWPQPDHFHIPHTWSAAHAFFFMRGVAEWGVPFTIETPHGPVHAHDATGYRLSQSQHPSSRSPANTRAIPLADGVLFIA